MGTHALTKGLKACRHLITILFFIAGIKQSWNRYLKKVTIVTEKGTVTVITLQVTLPS